MEGDSKSLGDEAKRYLKASRAPDDIASSEPNLQHWWIMVPHAKRDMSEECFIISYWRR